MSVPLSFDVHDFLDALNDSVGLRSGELVGSVGVWFANKFNDQSPEDKHDTMLLVRPVLRRHGFDICDSELGEQVGCECCSGESEFGRYKGRIPSDDDRVTARIWEFQPAINVNVMLSDSYEFGLDLDINYCPMCGRKL